MDELFSKLINFHKQVNRNIVNVTDTLDPFADLTHELDSDSELAENYINETKKRINTNNELNDFYYTTAIEYPFVHEPFMQSRYSDGTYPVWYGSLDLNTTIYETVYHMFESISAIDGYGTFPVISKSRAIYNVQCNGFLIDTTNAKQEFPQLVSNDYKFCQTLSKRIKQEGIPGLLSPSARSKGININIFKQQALLNPQVENYLTYRYSTNDDLIKVYDNQTDSEIMQINKGYYVKG